MDNIFDYFRQFGIIPVIKINKVENAIPLAKSLKNAGLPCAEITFRSKAANDAIRMIKDNIPDFIVGAGTLLSINQIELALSAGADFFVSPGLDENILAFCAKKNIPFLPGVITPSEIQRALNYNFDVLKFFPAEASGGVKTLDALCGPFPNVKFIPSGGINENNILDYVSRPNIIACGGSWFVKCSIIDNRKFNEISIATSNILMKIRQIKNIKSSSGKAISDF